jgi:hypothetical protein
MIIITKCYEIYKTKSYIDLFINLLHLVIVSLKHGK